MTRQFYSILPYLENEVGHSYEYSLCVSQAVTLHGWDYFAWIPKQCSIRNLPSCWEKILSSSRPLWDYLKALRKLDSHAEIVFFLENAGLLNTLIFCSALLLSGKRGSVWLLHRYAPSQMWGKGKLHALLFRLFQRKIYFQFFTDSELLLKQQQELFAPDIHLLPIPHAQLAIQKKFPKNPQILDCWWPGGQIRAAKGLREIQQFSQLLHVGSLPLRLVVAQKAQQAGVIPSERVLFIEDELSRKTYEMWMNTVDIVLLPYDPVAYHSGTSGIFVEAVVAGALPVVRKGTWLAHELNKYGLGELVVDWDDIALPEQLLAIYHNEGIQKKLAVMRSAYQQQHSLASFSKAFGRFLKCP